MQILLFLIGAYVPLTQEGNIMVNRVLVSCYANTHHDVAHLAMTLMHRFSAVMKRIFGDDTGLDISSLCHDYQRGGHIATTK